MEGASEGAGTYRVASLSYDVGAELPRKKEKEKKNLNSPHIL